MRSVLSRFRVDFVVRFSGARQVAAGLLLLSWTILAGGLAEGLAGGQQQTVSARVTVTVVDENGQAVEGAQVTIDEPGIAPAQLWTDYAGSCSYALKQQEPYQIHVEKPGFYEADESGIDPSQNSVRVVLAHEQIVREQVNVTASTPGIDTQQVADQSTMNTPEIVNIPYQTSRDIRNLLPFNPGVVQDATEQVHVAGSETWETLDTMDGFDIRSPVGGSLSLRVSADAVRSIDAETTRYPVEFGRATGGVIAFYTGMGDNKFRFNATNFIPSFRDVNGIRFDKFVPRFTFSGPLKRDRAWWYDGVEVEYDNIYISELPANADTDELVRGSNLAKVQANVTSPNILTAGLLYNNYHSPYDGIFVAHAAAEHREAQHDCLVAVPAGPAELCRRRAARFGSRVREHSRRVRAARDHALRDHAGAGGGKLFREPDRALAAAGGNSGVVSAAAALGGAARCEGGPGSGPHRL